jgi:L-2-hydroxyglutarate oxidase LhgO
LVQAVNVNANTGSATFTAKLQIIGAGGKADNVNVTFHVSPTAT